MAKSIISTTAVKKNLKKRSASSDGTSKATTTSKNNDKKKKNNKKKKKNSNKITKCLFLSIFAALVQLSYAYYQLTMIDHKSNIRNNNNDSNNNDNDRSKQQFIRNQDNNQPRKGKDVTEHYHILPSGKVLKTIDGDYGPTENAFVLDYDRLEKNTKSILSSQNSNSGKKQLIIEQMKKSSNINFYSSDIESCELNHNNIRDENQKIIIRSKCAASPTTMTKEKNKFIVYNHAPFPRAIMSGGTGSSSITVPPYDVVALPNEEASTFYFSSPNIPKITSSTIYEKITEKDDYYDIQNLLLPEIIIQSKEGKDAIDDRLLQSMNADGGICSSSSSSSTSKNNVIPPCRMETSLVNTYHNLKQQKYIVGTPLMVHQVSRIGDASSKLDPHAYQQDNYYSTPSFLSSIPIPLYKQQNLERSTSPQDIDYDKALPKAIYLASENCESNFSRNHRWFGELEKAFGVDSYGECFHNKDVPEGLDIVNSVEDRIALMSKYRFVLAFEQFTGKQEAMTSITIESFLSSAVPVVLGADKLTDSHLPPRSAILVSSYNQWNELSTEVIRVNESKTVWNSFHEWRKEPKYLQTLESLYGFTTIDADCRMCAWAYAKRYNMGWDHTKQMINHDLNIPIRQLCTTKNDNNNDNNDSSAVGELMTKPFREIWHHNTNDNTNRNHDNHENENETCYPSNQNSLNSIISIGGNNNNNSRKKLRRSILQHDGITDMMIIEEDVTTTTATTLLQLDFNISNFGLYFTDTHLLVPKTTTDHGDDNNDNHYSCCNSISIQDKHSRVTVITHFQTDIKIGYKQGGGRIDILIPTTKQQQQEPSLGYKIRIIIEDVDPTQKKSTEYFPSYFNKIMIQDFINPLQLYSIQEDSIIEKSNFPFF